MRTKVRIKWCESRVPGELVAEIVEVCTTGGWQPAHLVGAELLEGSLKDAARTLSGIAEALRWAQRHARLSDDAARRQLVGRTIEYKTEVH